MKQLIVLAWIVLVWILCGASVNPRADPEVVPPTPDDHFIRGYVTAVLEQVLKVPSIQVEVERGVVILRGDLPGEERQELLDAVSRIHGVARVEYIPLATGGAVPEGQAQEEFNRAFHGFFPKDDLFTPLPADPWESRFFLSFRHSEASGGNFGTVGLGEVFGLYRWKDVFGPGHHLQINIEGAAFGYFDLDQSQTDLQNIDFQLGLPVVYRYEDFSTRLRLLHRSAHLGDEYMARHPEIVTQNRLTDYQVDNNLFDAVFSYKPDWWRIYGGFAYLFDVMPERDPWEMVYGIELAPWDQYAIHPVLGVHFHLQEEFDWDLNHRYVFGVEIHDWPFRNRVTRLLGEYYHGKRLEWPFFREEDEYIGVGLYFDM
ncbi:MAG TPA: DUF1207 domain-containing protein [bacterium]|nr:DUF1207 domain-containing protein [bacterium]HOL96110.1 DUF1207 domain-containing protein [bacterium]